MIVQPSHAVDWKNEELRPLLDQFYRGSNGYEAVDKIKLVKLLWDAIGSEFGGRHELYERTYSGSHELTRLECWWMASGDGTVDRMKGFAEQCMAEYDLDGWTVDDLINPDDINLITGKKLAGAQPLRAAAGRAPRPPTAAGVPAAGLRGARRAGRASRRRRCGSRAAGGGPASPRSAGPGR